MSNTAEPTWILLRHAPKVESAELGHQLTVIRALSPAEYDEIVGIEALFSRFTNSWSWTLLTRKHIDYTESLATINNATNRSSRVLNSSDTRRIELALREFAELASNWLEELETSTDDDLRAAISRTRNPGGPISILTRIVQNPDISAVDVAAIAFTPLNISVTVAPRIIELGGLSGEVGVDLLLGSSMAKLEEIAGLELLSMKDDLLASAKFLRGLQAECIYGVPEIISSADLEAIKATGNLPTRQLPLEAIEPLSVALRTAEERLSGTPSDDQSRPSQMATAPPTRKRTRESERTGNAPVAPLARPADLALLVSEVRRLPTDIERRWSQGLEDSLNADNQVLLNRFSSLLQALLQEVSWLERSAADNASSFKVNFPLRGTAGNNIKLEPDSSERLQQTLLAELYAVRLFSNSLALLREPTEATFNLTTGEAESWWSSGGFSKLSAIAPIVTKLMNEVTELTETEKQTDIPPPVSLYKAISWIDYARQVNTSVVQGMPDTAVIYTMLALQQLGLTEGVDLSAEIEEVPESSRFSQILPAVKTLLEAARKLRDGHQIDLATKWCLASFWNDQLGDWVIAHYQQGALKEEPKQGGPQTDATKSDQ